MDNMVVYIENREKSTKTFMELVIYCSKVLRYEIDTPTSVAFLYGNDSWNLKFENMICCGIRILKYLG